MIRPDTAYNSQGGNVVSRQSDCTERYLKDRATVSIVFKHFLDPWHRNTNYGDSVSARCSDRFDLFLVGSIPECIKASGKREF